ncbi:MAG TPA: KUP/HAK/KT family potassium transporter [Humidesulfovibrio sp.]|uniref:potassium transporter Kup n=1 Tax=Humidesulfovibrio sp. TaxID=2910988 RepID=UPI002CEF11F2|nr:KUP/HAK/KT family potassium transporter [Humidesulfovibrio sp.]HWR04820.1 KUP/HAK/KT family potassium transporter [Humidesulfovibrio sp.]
MSPDSQAAHRPDSPAPAQAAPQHEPLPSSPAVGNGDNGEGRAHHASGRTMGLALAALGVVYGDIGTSPLYTVKECFHGPHAVALLPVNIMGVLSLILWSLFIVVSLKYVMFVMRADNKGEGGIFALLALVKSSVEGTGKKRHTLLISSAMFGAALLYGDGIITPAISVLSAMEGMNVATDAAEPFILPGTCIILMLLFMMQKHGTERIGKVFGPLMILWFAVIAALGVASITQRPEILAAVNPVHAVRFFVENHLHGMVVLGSVVLCITGGEALYADMGHFGRQPIRMSWYTVVLPSLMLNYFGQGALLLAKPDMAFNPFFGLVPQVLLYPMVALATIATVIASQAMISGVYSLTQQAVQLGYCPRIRIINTSAETKGQIYLPGVNNAMMLACIGLVLAFKSSSGLAGAYGIAVTATMAITSVIFFFVVHTLWRWPMWKTAPLIALFLVFDVAYLGSNLLKILDGGWFTLTVAALIMAAMATWRDGKAALGRQFQSMGLPLELFLNSMVAGKPPLRIPGTGVFMSVSATGTPITLLHHYKHNKVLHEQVLLLSISSAETPFVSGKERLQVTSLGHGFFRIIARYGFMQTPSVPEILRLAGAHGLHMDMASTSFYLGRETLLTGGTSRMMRWRKSLFAFMSRNAWNATTFFGIPPGRVVELGTQVEL